VGGKSSKDLSFILRFFSCQSNETRVFQTKPPADEMAFRLPACFPRRNSCPQDWKFCVQALCPHISPTTGAASPCSAQPTLSGQVSLKAPPVPGSPPPFFFRSRVFAQSVPTRREMVPLFFPEQQIFLTTWTVILPFSQACPLESGLPISEAGKILFLTSIPN